MKLQVLTNKLDKEELHNHLGLVVQVTANISDNADDNVLDEKPAPVNNVNFNAI